MFDHSHNLIIYTHACINQYVSWYIYRVKRAVLAYLELLGYPDPVEQRVVLVSLGLKVNQGQKARKVNKVAMK